MTYLYIRKQHSGAVICRDCAMGGTALLKEADTIGRSA